MIQLKKKHNWILENLIVVVIILIGVLTIVIMIFYVMKRLRRYRKKYLREKKGEEIAKQELNDINMYGPTVINDETVMIRNPMCAKIDPSDKKGSDDMVRNSCVKVHLLPDQQPSKFNKEQDEIRQKQAKERALHIKTLQEETNMLRNELKNLEKKLSQLSQPKKSPSLKKRISQLSTQTKGSLRNKNSPFKTSKFEGAMKPNKRKSPKGYVRHRDQC